MGNRTGGLRYEVVDGWGRLPEGWVYIPELQSRMSVLHTDGRLPARWGGEKTFEPGLFVATRCAWADTHGGLYVGEVLQGQRIQKFELHY